MKIPYDVDVEWLVENYLPDYNKRVDDYIGSKCSKSIAVSKSYLNLLRIEFKNDICNFSEALTAFAEQVAKEQREIIAENMPLWGAGYTYCTQSEFILSAPSPITKE